MNAPIDLTAVWQRHVERVLSDEGPGRDPRRLSGSDLHSCDYDLYERLRGAQRVPRTMSTFSAFERGHAYERRVFEALAETLPTEALQAYNPEFIVEHDGIPGHPDFRVELPDGARVVIDCTTTASKFTEWKYGHALKSAFYAVALKYDYFCEWVFSIGFGGNILAQEAHWFSLDEEYQGRTWRSRVERAIAHKKAIASLTEAPPTIPPIDPADGKPEEWRCKSYCDCICPLNQKLKPNISKEKP